ncbi:MAG TPA: hypothetical protein VJM32_01505 [Candidatus Saccharimonadales bacterium]|nr:hypothetical protein [Candidatus Saccharimonadales bacterium]
MKKLVTSYTFNAGAKTVDAADFTALEKILLITNVTTNTIIYNFADSAKGGSLAGTVLTLTYNTAPMSNGDKLQIFIDDGATAQAVSGTVTANLGSSVQGVQLNASQTTTTGTITTATSVVTMADLAGVGAVTVTIYGTYAGVNVTFEGFDGVNWVSVAAQQAASLTPSVVMTTGVLTTNSVNRWNVSPLLGVGQFRVRATAWTSGTANVIIEPSAQFTQYQVNVATMPTTTVSGTVTANLGTGGTGATSLGKAEDAVAASGDVGVATWGVRRDGAITTSPTTAAGDYTEMAVDTYGQTRIAVQSRTTNPTAGADGNGVILMADKLGKLVTVGSVRDLKVNQTTTITASTSETTVLTAVASTFLDVYGVLVANTSASAVSVAFKDATAGTTRFTMQIPAGDQREIMLPESAAITQAAINNNWTATVSTSVTSVVITMLAVRNT